MKLYRRILLLTLTLLLLVSASGLSVGLHLCGGKLQDLSFFGQDTDCPMEHPQQAVPPCHAAKKVPPADQECCQEHQLVFAGAEDPAATHTPVLLKAPDLSWLAAAVQVFVLKLLAPATSLKPTYALYASPPIARDIPVLVQSFLL